MKRIVGFLSLLILNISLPAQVRPAAEIEIKQALRINKIRCTRDGNTLNVVVAQTIQKDPEVNEDRLRFSIHDFETEHPKVTDLLLHNAMGQAFEVRTSGLNTGRCDATVASKKDSVSFSLQCQIWCPSHRAIFRNNRRV